ncbi:MAG TPA: hypothetical protein VFV23_11510 [Verrucomicrobiae bacterium]|nr:hypothetical protein [Verrucomicrobiae bacterium]
MNLIIPAAGQSSRFPKMRPKWMLTHPNGNLMLAEAIRGLTFSNLKKIYLVVLDAHLKEFKCLDGIKKQFRQIGLLDKLVVVALDQPTHSQPETVARAIEIKKIKGAVCIKDSDNFFRMKVPTTNFVSVVDLNSVGFVNPGNKSYADVNENHFVTNIVEKRVISNFFCSGAYGFEDAQEYLRYFNQLSGLKDLYISHIIYQMLLEDKAFSAAVCSEYSDWGTLKDWNRYKSQFGTLFVDLDGTLVVNSGEHFEPVWGTTSGIKENIEAINRLYDSGKVQIIITTSRKAEARKLTERQLKKEGVRYHQILFGLNHGKRIVINDYARSNPFKSCDSINIARNSQDLGEMLEGLLHTGS